MSKPKTPQNGDSGCFAGVLRRLLCQGSLQTHPSDQITELNIPEFNEQKEEPKSEDKVQAAAAAPGVVARLMGLESLPEANWVPKRKSNSPDSVTRSRSVNFMDYLLEFNASQSQHRRVRTSVSFREVPASLQQQNHDSFVLYLDEVDEIERKKMGTKMRKSGVEFEDLKKKKEKSKNNKENMRERLVMKKKENQGTSKKVSKFIDEPRRVAAKNYSKTNKCKGARDLGVVLPGKKYGNKESGETLKKRSPIKPMHQKEVPVKAQIGKKSKKQLVIEEVKPDECSSENSSPVSVLDVHDFSIYDDTPLSEEESYLDSNSKWKSSLKSMNCDYQSPHSTSILRNDDLELRGIKKKDYESTDNQNIDYYVELVAELLKFTEETITQSNWMSNKVLTYEDVEEFCMEIGQQILDLLLEEVVDELVEFNMETGALY